MNKIAYVSVCLLALAGIAAAGNGPKIKQTRTLDANAWKIYTTNYGPFVYPYNNAPGGYWRGPGYNYIFGAGLWIGGLDTLDSARVAIGYYPASGGSELCPVNPITYNWTNWATDTASRVYLSTDPNDLANWPVKDSLGNNIVKSQQDGYAVYSDENPAFGFTGEKPLGVRVKQHSYTWNYAFYNDILFFTFELFNVTADSLRGVYVGPCFDADIGDESGTLANDRTDFDYTRNLGIQYQTDPEPGWPRVGQLGCRMLATPLNNTGATVHVVDNQYPHDIAPGQQLGMTAFKIFTIDIDPASDPDRYLTMEGISYKTHVQDAYDELGSVTPGDKRFIMTSGPFNMAAGDSVTFSIAVMAAYGRDTLLALADSAAAIYQRELGVAQGPARHTSIPAALQMRNTPNPVAHSTVIAYQLPATADVSLKIYNIAGQLVRTMVSARQAAGAHSVRWNGDDDQGRRAAEGVYLYQLQAGGRSIARRMVLVK
ncbi:MAG TPA: FlgD immunoglobulin-like domain containing protein [Candidatus Edwardsbacteria bacterium]|nr:FlgD immunoglobulin-like domain containing protein [Candidatus Edwardsbacteria bacterium]